MVAAPAIRLAEEGWIATEATSVVATMLAAITGLTAESRDLFQPGGRPLQVGDRVVMPEAARALRAFAKDGAEPFVSGEYAQRLVEGFGTPHGSIGTRDLRAFEPRFVAPLSIPFLGATLHVPAPPCSGGALLAFGLRVFAAACPESPTSEDLVRCFAEVMAATERARAEGFDQQLFEDDAVTSLLNPATLQRHASDVVANRERPNDSSAGAPTGRVPGNTTHISVVDAAGNAVSFTSSNGETCGNLWPGTGLPVNNFLGEDDIHPLGFHKGPPGARFRTGMTPALLVDAEGGVTALGTGGSNRIRTAMLQVVRHIVDGGMSVEEAVMAPRIHVEGDGVQVEDIGQGKNEIDAAAASGRKLARFEGRHLYFGGVHTARRRADGSFEVFGDPRRSGAGRIARGS